MAGFPSSMHFLILYTISLWGILWSAVSVTATPIPVHLAPRTGDYSIGLVTVNRTSVDASSLPASVERPRSSDTRLLESYDAAKTNADKLRSLANLSGTLDGGDFQQQYSSMLSAYEDNVSDFHDAVASTLSDKGLANYDSTNSIETILKEFFNLNKGLFNSVNDFLPTVPIVGPIVGPIFYNIKCLLDGILDEVEDASDGAINTLQPVLAAVLGKTVTSTCASGVELVGLCI